MAVRPEIERALEDVGARLEELVEQAIPSDPDADPTLDRIAIFLGLQDRAFQRARSATVEAREAGRTWSSIADATGLPYPASAEQRLGPGRERQAELRRSQRKKS